MYGYTILSYKKSPYSLPLLVAYLYCTGSIVYVFAVLVWCALMPILIPFVYNSRQLLQKVGSYLK